ncbi:MAG: acetolactate synthase small subunit [Lachnospiraceae bacterium]|nr:acetolactate synthase small subunit [Lachnospiraceae bacterium]
MRKVLSILVENTSGVLSHVSGLFSRRGYNIDSFSAGVTSDPRFTRMTIVTSGDEQILEQIEKQVAKLEDVVDIRILEPEASVRRELMLVKVKKAILHERHSVFSLAEEIANFHGKVVDETPDSLVVEVTGNTDKLDSFLQNIADYEILQLARTGLTALSRGSEDVVTFET